MKNPASISAFGQHLRKLREDRGLSLQMLADESNVAKPTLFRVETAKATPTLDLLVSLARGLNVTVRDLVDIPDLEKLDEV
ncbi:helix-turn-helix domain-containing protein [Hymenobacter sp. 5516J-16]|uniref:helix-turn-helix domain-containing protein n=1 Tax=Hymenobacter sp. 5516J-16 TaxID=2932253 RepID=UPI003978DD5E